ncbi:MAG: hypothetical protein COA78_07740 [Blastopirellula sp.]|nr:MAG: hypothetical protein COA78_07740 [Blastopirellula sp.]
MITPIILTAVFVLVLVCTLAAFKDVEFFSDVRMVLAPTVAALCVFSLGFGSESSGSSPLVETILLPYAALAYSLIFLALLWLLSRIPWVSMYLDNREIRKSPKEIETHKKLKKRDKRKISK